MQGLRFSALTQQGFEIWPTTHYDLSAVGHQLFALQTTLKTALGIALTHSNEKSRVSAIRPSVSEGGRAKMQNCPIVIPNAKEMTENNPLFIYQGSKDEITITEAFSFVNPSDKLFFWPSRAILGPKHQLTINN